MRTSLDPRHQKRRQLVQSLFTWEFQKMEEGNNTYQQIIKNLPRIDSLITKSAPQWPLDQVNKIDLAILRLAVFELVLNKQEPEKVIIDEAVELAKEFGGQSSPAFVNGVLGTILKEKQP